MGLRDFLLALLTAYLHYTTTTQAIVGYDCGPNQLNITTLSLLDVGACEIPQPQLHTESVNIQLLQISDYTLKKVIQCKIEVHRRVSYCGMYSHTSAVANGYKEYIQEISHEQCNLIHKTGVFTVGQSGQIFNLKPNNSYTHTLTIAGSLSNNGACTGSQFSDPFGTWSTVFVEASYRISLREYYAAVNLNQNKIHLNSGVVCLISDSTCTDVEGGQTFWDPLPPDTCNFKNYEVLYTGPANKTYDNTTESSELLYSLVTEDVTFVLAHKTIVPICNILFVRTEHPKLLIYETKQGMPLLETGSPKVHNMDMFTYVNSKFVYVERHIRTEINRLYQDVLTQKCKLEQQALRNSLILATQAPDEFAYHFMKGPGYMSIVAGEVVHIVQCVPVEVTFRETKECYMQLPILSQNQTRYLTPRTHIISNTGTQISCNTFIRSMYFFGEKWFKMLPNPVEGPTPNIMMPKTTPTWKYTNPSSLATSGIYSQADLDKLRDHIMFQAEKPMVLNTLVKGVMGQPTDRQGFSVFNLLDEETIDKIAQSAWGKFWTIFTNFGTTSAGLIGIIIIIRGIKLIADTLIHGYTLHKIFGWSLHLLGAFWDSVTNLLLHLGTKPPVNRTNEGDQNAPIPSAPNAYIKELNPLLQPSTNNKIDTGKEESISLTTNTSLYPHLQQEEERSKTNYSIQF